MGGPHVKRTATAAVLLAALATLTACSSSDDSSTDAKPAATSASPSADYSAAERAAGIPPEPTGADRDALLAALRDVDPALVADEDDAIDNARNQCAAINRKADRLDYFASQRFSNGDVEVTEEQGKHINVAIGEFCKTA
ncbi:hypothetical protein ABZ368_19240 [Streptomyces sp. NPDC005908]|uniref:hypothetical protein n=1 Tax=Streptomyces sp. NPDC005908 TaxID=3157084 RepID=UPI0033D2CDFD